MISSDDTEILLVLQRTIARCGGHSGDTEAHHVPQRGLGCDRGPSMVFHMLQQYQIRYNPGADLVIQTATVAVSQGLPCAVSPSCPQLPVYQSTSV